MRRAGGRAPSIPLFAPQPEASRLLVRLPIEKLRAAAEARGMTVPARAGRKQVAAMLVVHSLREKTESSYRDTGIGFETKESAYPQLRKLVKQQKMRRILDVGCGNGLFAQELVQARALPGDGSYLGLDVSPTAIELARKLFVDDPRFRFEIGDAKDLAARPRVEVDGIVISFVLTYLDTVTADRMFRDLARAYPATTVIVALTFRACADRLEGVELDEPRELRAARKFLAGDAKAAAGIWDTGRWNCYVQSLATHYDIASERVLAPLAQKIWVLHPKSAPKPARRRGK
jgi:SAM-dependent methyltransferase